MGMRARIWESLANVRRRTHLIIRLPLRPLRSRNAQPIVWCQTRREGEVVVHDSSAQIPGRLRRRIWYAVVHVVDDGAVGDWLWCSWSV